MRGIKLTLVVLLLAVPTVFAAARGTAPSLPPVVVQEMGLEGLYEAVSYGPTVYPVFKGFDRYWDGEELCMNKCLEISGQPIAEEFVFKPIITATINFADQGEIDGIGVEYQKNSGIFVTWTVRVKGSMEFISLWVAGGGGLCQVLGVGGWHGYVEEEFRGGKVKTRLIVGSRQRGNDAVMTIPFQGSDDEWTEFDPTITGSAYLKSDDFGGTFPDPLKFEVQWSNETPLTITSPLDEGSNTTRNLIITIAPVR